MRLWANVSRSIVRKVVLTLGVLGSIVTGLMLYNEFVGREGEAWQKEIERARTLGESFAVALEADLAHHDDPTSFPPHALQSLSRGVHRPGDPGCLIVVDAEGKIVASDCGPRASHYHPLEIARKSLATRETEIAEDKDETRLAVAAPIRNLSRSKTLGLGDYSVILEVDASPALMGAARSVKNSFAVSTSMLLVVLTLSYLLLDRILLRRMRLLAEQADRLASGDFSARAGFVAKDDGDELDRLAKKYDQMAQEIADQRSRIDVTERRFKTLADHVPEVFWVADAEARRVSYASPACMRVFGVDAETICTSSHPFVDRLYHDDRETWKAGLERMRAEGIASFEHRVTIGRGPARWIATTMTAVRDADGKIEGITGVSRDVTEGRRAEEALRWSESRYRALAENASVGIWHITFDGETIYANPWMLRVLEVESLAELRQRPPFSYVDPADERIVRAQFAQRKRGVASSYEVRLIGAKGKSTNVMISGAPMMAVDGALVGMVGTFVDLTERRRAEVELLRLAAAFEQSNDRILLLSVDGVVEYASPSFLKSSGEDRAATIGRRFSEVQRRRGIEVDFAEVVAGIRRDGRFARPFEASRDGKSREVEETIVSPVKDPIGAVIGYVSVGRDATKETALEEQVRLAQKMEAIGLLAGGVAHDFNNLLQVIEGFASMAMDTVPPESQASSYIGEVRSAAARAAELTSRLLMFGRKRSLKLQHIVIVPFIEEVLKMTRRIIGEDVMVSLESDHDIGGVEGDRSQIEQVLLNIIVNARDAMPQGGSLLLRIRRVAVDEEFRRAKECAAAAEFIKIEIADSGVGMDQKTMGRIFEPFFTTKPKDRGTGLGLSVVYGIVKQHGGTIEVESAIGKGTTFSLFLPRSVSIATVTPIRVRPEARGGRETLLLAEDDPQVRDLAMRHLERSGYRVLVAQDGEEACKVFDAHMAEIACVVMDVVMPKMGGRTAAEYIRSKKQDVPILFTTGYSGSYGGDESSGNWPFGSVVLAKPYDANRLLHVLRRLIEDVPEGSIERAESE